MIVTLLVVGFVAALAIVLALLAFLVLDRRRSAPLEAVLEPTTGMQHDGLIQDRLRERFIVTAASGESFDGLLMEVDDRTVVMQNVSVLKADGAATPVDGEVILRRDAVAYMQRP